MKRKERESTNRESNLTVQAVVFIAGIVLVAVFVCFIFFHERRQKSITNLAESEKTEKWQEGVISYDGKYYKYNNYIKSYLFMGIDRNGPVEEIAAGGNAGQADVLFLLVEDKKHQTLSAIAINRNTMTEIGIYDINNKKIEDMEEQICLSHSFGDGERLSCSYTVDAVSHLLNDIPISGYYAMNMDGMIVLNDAIGGVTVEVMDDLSDSGKGVYLKAGQTKTLTGKEAYVYVRSRDVNTFNSATRRLERQQQYVEAMISRIRGITGKEEALGIYEQLKDYSITDMTIGDFVTEVKDFVYSGEMYSLPGEMQEGKNFEEFYVDGEALYKMVIDIFYEEVEAPKK